ncbi:DNA annealing helicase and endonuclease ZRANB3 [Acipenser ruthenus]|uniref:DNA annealing helicase and endonuclease ZRANB3 n=1 Tax=Acipenser ruthenus TaxID=7906 RepID=A0A662YUJ1_ACIRT|nr:DNA annealing helicase and endonuclease ZRANB3 [Acipenser ruthenus]
MPATLTDRASASAKLSVILQEASASFEEWEKLMRALDSGIAGTDNSFVEVMGLIMRMYKQTAIAKAGALKDYITMMLENEKLKFLVFAHHLTMLQACTEAVIEAKGLTFTAATRVVFAELYWNPGHMKQAEDRAHRIGQCSSVHIHYLIAKGTFNTVMWGMLNRKFEKEKQHDICTFFSSRAGKENKRKRPTEESPAGIPNDEDKAEMTILHQSVEEGTMTKGGSQEIADEEILEIATEPQSKRRSQRVSEGASLLWKKLPAVEREWNCISCTYTNSSLLPYCEVCETCRDSSNSSKEESLQSNKATSEKEQVPEGLSQTDCLVISDTDSESDSNTRTDPEQTNEMEIEKQKPEKSQCNKSPSENIEDAQPCPRRQRLTLRRRADSQEKGYLQALDAEGNLLCICCQLPSLQVNSAWDTRFCSQRCQEEFLVHSNQSYKRVKVFETEQVYCGLTSQGQLIAVKQVALDSSDQATAEKEYQRLQEEVDLLKTLDHSNIVGFLGTCLEVNIMSIFMEFVPGGSVASIINRFGPLPEKVFAIYTKQILEGIEYLHNSRVIHRDLKREQCYAYAHWYYKTHRFWLCQAFGLFEHDRHQQRNAQVYAWHSILDGARSHQ